MLKTQLIHQIKAHPLFYLLIYTLLKLLDNNITFLSVKRAKNAFSSHFFNIFTTNHTPTPMKPNYSIII